MQEKLNWQAFSNNDRNQVIENIKNEISNADGYIINFNLFSDLALTLSIEIEENKIEALHKSLSHIVNLSAIEFNNLNSTSKKEWLIFINISFSKGKGYLKQKIPDVPG